MNNSGSVEVGVTAAVPVVFPAGSTGNVTADFGIAWESGGKIAPGAGGRCHPAGYTTHHFVNPTNPHLDYNYSTGVCFLRAHAKVELFAVLLDMDTGHEYSLLNGTGNSSSPELSVNELLYFSTTVTQTCYGPGNTYGHPSGCSWKNNSKFTSSGGTNLSWGISASDRGNFSTHLGASGIAFHSMDNWSVVFTCFAYAIGQVGNSVDGSARAWINMATVGHDYSLASIAVS